MHRSVSTFVAASTATFALVCAALPARADLTPEQKQKLRALLSLPPVNFSVRFTATRDGFGLEDNNPKATAMMRLVRSSAAGSPLAQARSAYRRGLDYKTLGDGAKAPASFAKAEALLRQQEAALKGVERARALCLLADVLAARATPEATAAALKTATEAARIAPQAWEPQETLANLHLLQAGLLLGSDDPKKAALPERVEAAAGHAVQAAAQAVALQEKAQPDPVKRDPQPYISQVYVTITAPATARYSKAQQEARTTGKPAALNSSAYVEILQQPAVLGAVGRAVEASPRDPFAVGFMVYVRSISKLTSGTPALEPAALTDAQTRLKIIADDPRLSKDKRAAALFVAGGLYAMDSKFDDAVPLLQKALELSPSDDRMRIACAVCLTKLSPARWNDAEDLLTAQLEKRSSANLRGLLAKIYDYQGEVENAQRVLDAAYGEEKKHPLIQIGMAAARMKLSGDDIGSLRTSGELLTEAGTNNPNLSGADWVSYMETTAIYYALYDEPNDAKETAQTLLKYAPGNQVGKAVLDLLP